MDFFSSRQTAQRKLARLCDQKKVVRCGTVRLNKRGAGFEVFCIRPVRQDTLLHDVLCTKVVLPHVGRGWTCRRGADVDSCTLPDAELVRPDGVRFAVEMDRGTIAVDRVVKRLEKYRGGQAFVLVVTATESRLKRLLAATAHLSGGLLLAPLARVRENPLGEVYEDHLGERVSIGS